MQTKGLTIPELIVLGGTRVALGAGVGLLASGLLNRDQRKAAGLALLTVGVISTIPIVANIRSKPDLEAVQVHKPHVVKRQRRAA